MQYAPVTYSVGAAEASVTPGEAAKAERELKRMRSSLKGWLKFRLLNDQVAAGKMPSKLPRQVAAQIVTADRAGEQQLALQLYTLLSEVMDAQRLPNPDLSTDPNAAVKLARIAITGKVPSEAAAPAAQGIFWLWPVVIIVGGVLFTVMTAIRSRADVQKEKERLKCIQAGACTDYGFWLKISALLVGGWVVWDKLGLREKVQGRK